MKLSIITQDSLELADKFSYQLNAPINPEGISDFSIFIEQDQVFLKDHQATANPLPISFNTDEMQWRLKSFGMKQPLAKAMGVKKNFKPSIIDTTAGLGRDSVMLAHVGCSIRMIERSALLHALLQHALQAYSAENMELFFGEATELLESLIATKVPDVIYLDPMFPPRQKSALVKKEMQLLQRLHDDSDDQGETLLKAALGTSAKRIVVKRPTHAPALLDLTPSHSIKTKTTRFDVWIR